MHYLHEVHEMKANWMTMSVCLSISLCA
jgi:hypothetical protein